MFGLIKSLPTLIMLFLGAVLTAGVLYFFFPYILPDWANNTFDKWTENVPKLAPGRFLTGTWSSDSPCRFTQKIGDIEVIEWSTSKCVINLKQELDLVSGDLRLSNLKQKTLTNNADLLKTAAKDIKEGGSLKIDFSYGRVTKSKLTLAASSPWLEEVDLIWRIKTIRLELAQAAVFKKAGASQLIFNPDWMKFNRVW